MSDEDYVEPWSWVPHVEGADREKEINAHLNKMLDNLAFAKGPVLRWNPTTSRMEPYSLLDDMGPSAAGGPLTKEAK